MSIRAVSEKNRIQHRRKSAWRSFGRPVGLIVLVLLGGCAANGDFGRVKPSLIKDDIHRWVGSEAPGRHGKPPSQFPLTDAERQLRDLAYPLIEPPYDRQRWFSVLSEYGVHADFNPPYPDRRAYADKLLSTAVRSQTALYNKLIDDVRNDVVRVDPFFSVGRYIVNIDRKREQAMARFSRITADQKSDARARIAENTAVIRWVQRSLRERAASYQIALERLVIAAPSPMAAEVDRSLTLLGSRIAAHRNVLEPAVAEAPPLPDQAIDVFPK